MSIKMWRGTLGDLHICTTSLRTASLKSYRLERTESEEAQGSIRTLQALYQIKSEHNFQLITHALRCCWSQQLGSLAIRFSLDYSER